jgi:hypothetical protein
VEAVVAVVEIAHATIVVAKDSKSFFEFYLINKATLF